METNGLDQGLSGVAYVDEVDQQNGDQWRFYRTKVEETAHLTNGRAWIQTFEHVLKNLPQNLPRPRRTLGVSLSDSGDPRYSMPAYGVKQRNDAAKAMREPQTTPGLPEGARHGVGTQLRLPSGDEVLLICNVGAQCPAELPRKFREMALEELSLLAVGAKCPHQGGCLNEGEIKDVEDIVASGVQTSRRAIIRCPWHNMQFDLQTGEGIGNHLRLERYPVRVMYGAVYIGVRFLNGRVGGGVVGPAMAAGGGCSQALDAEGAAAQAPSMDVDMEGATEAVQDVGCLHLIGKAPLVLPVSAPAAHGKARSRSPPRQLRQHKTAC